MLRLQITTGAPQAIAPAAAGQSEALAVAKRELAASQQEVALLREALASDSPESPSSRPVQPLALTAGPTPVGVGLGGAVVRLSIRRPTGEYLKVEVGSQTLISELKATLVGLTDMPIRQQVRTYAASHTQTGLVR